MAKLIRQISEQAERKQVTVLFCDVADYTNRSVVMDPEDLADEIHVFQTVCGQIAEKYNGHIANFLGDAILVLFGYPNANEYDPERAIRAGLEMVDAIKSNNMSTAWQGREPIAIRVSIATGLVVIGERAGKKRDQDELIIGESPNLAARLQTIAGLNTVVIAGLIRDLVGSIFILKDLGEKQLKGFKNFIRVWQVLRENTLHKRTSTTLKRVTSKFIGREKELKILHKNYQLALQNNSRIVHISGEPGIGKSRLVRVFEKGLYKNNLYRIRITCSPYFRTSPLKAVVDEVLRWLRLSSNDDLVTHQTNITWGMSILGMENTQAHTLFSDMLSIEPLTSLTPLNISADARRQRTIHLMVKIAIALAKIRPLLIIVEDLHWADSSTLSLLTLLTNTLHKEQCFIIYTSRPQFQPTWIKRAAVTNIKLKHLNGNQSQQLVDAVCCGYSLSQTLRKALVKKSSGIPMFIEESCWGLLTMIKNTSEFNPTINTLMVPETLQDSLNEQLDQLGDAKLLAQLAATFGYSFGRHDLKLMAQENRIEFDKGFKTLLNSNLIESAKKEQRNQYTFRHAMIKEAAYNSLLIRTRQHYHRQIANQFIKHHSKQINTHPELIAYHYSNADCVEQAFKFWMQAAKQAINKSAVKESIEHLQQATKFVHRVGDEEVCRQNELELQLQLGIALNLSLGYSVKVVANTYKRALQLCRDHDPAEQRWSTYYGLWRSYISQVNFYKALKCAVKLQTLAAQYKDRRMSMTSVGIKGLTRLFTGRFNSAIHFIEQSAFQYDKDADRSLGVDYGQDPGINIMGLGAVGNLITGRLDFAAASIDEALELAVNFYHPYTLADSYRIASIYAHISCDLPRLKEYAAKSHKLGQDYSFAEIQTATHIFLAYIDIITNHDGHAISRITKNLKIYEHNNGFLFAPYFRGMLAESYLALDKFEQAFQAVKHAIEIVAQYGESWYLSELIRLKAVAAARGKLADEAKIHCWYQQADAKARLQNAKYFRLRTAISYAQYTGCKTAIEQLRKTSKQLAEIVCPDDQLMINKILAKS